MSDTSRGAGTIPAHGLLCPNCRVDLVMSERQGIEIDYCPKCRGVWLDRGELDKIIERSVGKRPGWRRNSPRQHRRRPPHRQAFSRARPIMADKAVMVAAMAGAAADMVSLGTTTAITAAGTDPRVAAASAVSVPFSANCSINQAEYSDTSLHFSPA